MTGRVIARCAWTCIRESREDDGLIYYDVWRYSQARGRWARHEQNTGYGDLMEAIRDAKAMSDNLLVMPALSRRRLIPNSISGKLSAKSSTPY